MKKNVSVRQIDFCFNVPMLNMVSFQTFRGTKPQIRGTKRQNSVVKMPFVLCFSFCLGLSDLGTPFCAFNILAARTRGFSLYWHSVCCLLPQIFACGNTRMQGRIFVSQENWLTLGQGGLALPTYTPASCTKITLKHVGT